MSNPNASIIYVNAVYSAVDTDDLGLIEAISERLTIKDYEHRPSKFSKWDGTKRLFDRKTRLFPNGYLREVLEECKYYGAVEVDQMLKDRVRPVSREEIYNWIEKKTIVNDRGETIEPFDYQKESVYLFTKFSALLLKAATNAGKSLILYLCCLFYNELLKEKTKILIVVPTIGLTTQLRDNFLEFSSQDSSIDMNQLCHVAGDGVSPYSHKRIIISTWQTLKNQQDSFFLQFNCLLFDEVHGASSACCSKICELAVNADQRLGVTGTFRSKDHENCIKRYFGAVQVAITTKQTQDRGISAQTQVYAINLHYSLADKKRAFDMDYQEEMRFLMEHEQRNEIIKNLARSLKGNSLFLFDRVDNHLLKLKEYCENAGLDVLIIHGSVKPEERDYIKKKLEKESGLILFATFGTLSTGISIRNLKNLIFCYPTKSIIRVLQSIGRMLRKHEAKDVATIYDIVDNLKYMDRNNYSYTHALDRLGFYRVEEHAIKVVTKNL